MNRDKSKIKRIFLSPPHMSGEKMRFMNCDIPDNCVAVGVPAKIIKSIDGAEQI
jgi:hypothetical protein